MTCRQTVVSARKIALIYDTEHGFPVEGHNFVERILRDEEEKFLDKRVESPSLQDIGSKFVDLWAGPNHSKVLAAQVYFKYDPKVANLVGTLP